MEHDEVRERAEHREAVGLVDEQLLGVGEHASAPDDGLELLAERGLAGGIEGDHGLPGLYPRDGLGSPSRTSAASTIAGASI